MRADEFKTGKQTTLLERAYRFFPNHVEAFAIRAAADPFCINGEEFRIVGQDSGTATGAAEVHLLTSNLSGWIKPARQVPAASLPRVLAELANEKIASDLAFELGLPVAPVVLVNSDPGMGLSPILAVSLSTLPQGRRFTERSNLAHWNLAEVIRIASAMSAFNTFVADGDHGGNDGNQTIDVLPGTPATTAMSFFDYAISLTHGWDTNALQPPAQPMTPVGSFDKSVISDTQLDRQEVRRFVNRIETLPDDKIRNIIFRLPDAMISPNLKNSLFVFLVQRRSLLRSIMGV